MRGDPDELRAHLAELEPDEEDVALLEHIFGDGRPPQGLHRHGWKCSHEWLDVTSFGDGERHLICVYEDCGARKTEPLDLAPAPE